MRYFFLRMRWASATCQHRDFLRHLHCLSESPWPSSWLRCSSGSILSQLPPLAPYSALRTRTLASLTALAKKCRPGRVYKVSFTTETGHFDGHILAGNKVACFPKCLLLHLIMEGEEQHLFFSFLLAHNPSVMWVWHQMTAVNTAGHLLAFQWRLY